MIKILLFSLFSLVSFSAWCQTFSYGIKAGYVTYHRLYANSHIEGTHIQGSQNARSFMDGWRLAVITRAEHKKWSAQTELAYAYNIGGNGSVMTIDNSNNPANTATLDSWISGGSTLLKQTELSLSGGYKPLKWIRLSTGLGIWHIRAKEKQALVLYNETRSDSEEADYWAKAQNEMKRFTYGIQNSYQPIVLTHQLGIGFEIKRNFSLDITYDRSLTPVSKKLEYKGQHYTFRQSTDRFVVSLGYRFYQLKNNNKLFKKRS
jgi:hypothetical protein